MEKRFNRQLRIGREMKKAIANLLHSRFIQDTHINTLITVSDVKISRDLSHAKVYFTVLENENSREDTIKNSIKILEKASSYIRVLLGRVMRLRLVPKLTFCYDSSLIVGMQISRLLSKKKDHKKVSKCT